jgi:molybdopterin molybdotransferase
MGMPARPAERVALASAVAWQPALTGYLPVRLSYDDWARPWASPSPTNNSGDFSALALTDGFVELPPGPADLAKGYVTRLFRW